MAKKIEWKELDEEYTKEQEILRITFSDTKNDAGEIVFYWYCNAILNNGKAVGLTSNNENDGTSASPMSYCDGHHTAKEYLKDFYELYDIIA